MEQMVCTGGCGNERVEASPIGIPPGSPLTPSILTRLAQAGPVVAIVGLTELHIAAIVTGADPAAQWTGDDVSRLGVTEVTR